MTKVVCVLLNAPVADCWFAGRPIGEEYPIVDGGKLAGVGARSYSAANATRGSKAVGRFNM